MNTKQAKDFLVEQATEQAALEHLPLSDIEKRMMYFTESDPLSCPDPFALNDEFEAQYDSPEYEDQDVRAFFNTLTAGWKQKTPKESACGTNPFANFGREITTFSSYGMLRRPASIRTRDNFKLIGIGLFIAMGFGIAAFVAVKYNFDVERYRKVLQLTHFRRGVSHRKNCQESSVPFIGFASVPRNELSEQSWNSVSRDSYRRSCAVM